MTDANLPDQIPKEFLERVRHFNRFYTKYMGLFAQDYLKIGLSVTELRIFHEISIGAGGARDISQELAIDEGYLSRIVKRFVREGWAIAVPSSADARRKTLSLTSKGQAFYDDLAEKTRNETARRLNGADVPAAVATMQKLEGLLVPPDLNKVVLRDLDVGDIGWAIQRNGEIYNQEFGFDASFEIFAGRILLEILEGFDPATHAAAIACRGTERLGCIFCVPSATRRLAKLRVFFVEPHARGLRLGHRLMARCLEQGRALGYTRMELMTIQSQQAARHLYASYGFEMTDSVSAPLAGRDVVEEKWVCKL